MKSPSDPRLTLIATMAKVRPSHVFHTYHSMAEMGKGFHAEAFASFAMLEVRHVLAIVEALTTKGWLPAPKRASESKGRASRLPTDFTMPDEWIMAAREKRLWSLADTLSEAEIFTTHFHKTGQAYVDWQAAWRGWYLRSNRANGMSAPSAQPLSTEGQIEWHERQASFYDRIGKTSEASDHRAKVRKLRGNVVPIRSVG